MNCCDECGAHKTQRHLYYCNTGKYLSQPRTLIYRITQALFIGALWAFIAWVYYYAAIS